MREEKPQINSALGGLHPRGAGAGGGTSAARCHAESYGISAGVSAWRRRTACMAASAWRGGGTSGGMAKMAAWRHGGGVYAAGVMALG